MATYTENYNLKKPTYAEPANVKDINDNMEIIDDVMHSTQISLADAYDQNETYNTGDIVMYEMLMYKCKEDNVTGAWNASKWERTTAGESGGGADLDIYGEASGTAEASFSDGAEAGLVECEIGIIVPTQDLHGYNKPWAGGTGKNKLEVTATTQTVRGVTFTVNNDGTIRVSGTNTSSGGINIIIGNVTLPQGTYTISTGNPTGAANNTHFLNIDPSATGLDVNENVFTTYTFTDSATTTHTIKIYVRAGITVNALYKPMVESGSMATPYEPYSNICPISGHTDVTVTVASTSGGSGEDYTVSLGTTYYGGNLNVTTGELEVTWGNIASYAGETLTGEWLSSLDEYSALGTPTTGAQVVYELATPQTFNLTPTQVKTLLGQNYVSHDGGGTISLVYVKGDAPIKPNPADAEIPLTGLEINGEKFKIESGGYQIDTLLNETNGVTVGVTYGFLDGHTLSEYDEIELIIATRENISGNLGYDRWVMSVQGLLDFPVINYGAYGERWFHATFTNNSFIQNNTSGDQYPYVYRIYGIKH